MTRNLIKRWRGSKNNPDGGGGGGTSLAKRPQGGADTGLARFRDEMDRVFDRAWRDFEELARNPWSALPTFDDRGDWPQWPAIDVAEDEHNFTLRADVPGLGPDDVEVEVLGDTLTIRGQRQDEWSDDGRGVKRRERRCGSFVRTITLPPYVDPEKVQAKYDKGTVSITLPKVPGKGPKRVNVTAT
jgi:HSP20 family protein